MIAPSDRRLPALDGLRGIAILLVMQFHFWNLSFGLSGWGRGNGLDRALDRITGVGWSGVDLFFVLSGFLITGILYDAKNSNGYFRAFYARRALRIVPVYYAFILFVLLIAPLFTDLSRVARVNEFRDIQFWFWTFMVNIAESVKQFDVSVPFVHSHFWSLAVEEQFYLVWPLVVLACGRRTLMGVCMAMVLGAFIFRLALIDGFASDVFELSAPAVLMPARMDTLALGALVALSFRGDGFPVLQRAAPYSAAAAGLVLLGLFVANDGLSIFETPVLRYGYTALAVLYASVLVLVLAAASRSRIHRFLTHPVLLTFGRYSYAMYVVHLLLAVWLVNFCGKQDLMRTAFGSHTPFNLLFSLTATLLTLGIAWASWRLIERPFLRLKSRFEYGRNEDRPRADEDAGTASRVPVP